MAAPIPRTRVVNRGFSGWVIASLLLHGSLVGGVVYAQSLQPPRIDLSDAIPVELVQLGERRDPDLLPRKAPPAPPPAEPPPPEVPVAEPPPPAEPPETAVPLETTPPPPKPEPAKKKPPPAKKPPPTLSKAAQKLLGGRTSDDGRLDDAISRLEKAQGDPNGSRLGTTTDSSKIAAEGYTQQRSDRGAQSPRTRCRPPFPSAQRRFLKATVVLHIDRNGRASRSSTSPSATATSCS